MTSRRDIGELQDQIRELFEDLWQEMPQFSGLRRSFRPAADSCRTEEPPALHVVVELPGVEPEKIQVVVGGRMLVIAGVRERPRRAGARIQQMELDYGPFRRQIQLTEDVDSAAATATYDRGLLEITLPLAPAAPPRTKVPIEVRRPR